MNNPSQLDLDFTAPKLTLIPGGGISQEGHRVTGRSLSRISKELQKKWKKKNVSLFGPERREIIF